jgi:hypothetical protein
MGEDVLGFGEIDRTQVAIVGGKGGGPRLQAQTLQCQGRWGWPVSRGRGVPGGQARLLASVGVTIFQAAFERWSDPPEQTDFSTCFSEATAGSPPT